MIGRSDKRRHQSGNAALIGTIIIGAFYFAALFADTLAPYSYRDQVRQQPSAPPTAVHFRDESGQWHLRPFIYSRKLVDPTNLVYEEDRSQRFPLVLFGSGTSYRLLGLMTTDLHLFGVSEIEGRDTPRFNLLGTDQLGRDRFSRLLFAMRFSLLVSPLGTLLACILGIAIGSISGYSSPAVDSVLMGVTDTIISLPTLILILAARAAFPPELPPMSAAMLLILIFAAAGWAEMSRLTRGLVVSMKEQEFVMAGRSIGLTEFRLLRRYVLPNIMSPLLVQATLMLPAFLLAEVALSFLGVGLLEPEPSLGNMLSSASDLSVLRRSPVLLLSPAIVIFLFVLGIRLIARDGGNMPARTDKYFYRKGVD
jgi:peptide/nickel transport system permease protein